MQLDVRTKQRNELNVSLDCANVELKRVQDTNTDQEQKVEKAPWATARDVAAEGGSQGG